MGALCCCGYGSSTYYGVSRQTNSNTQSTLRENIIKDNAPPLSPEEAEERRKRAAEAAEKRSKNFQQGGGGEKLKAKAKALEEAEQKNRELGGPNKLKWQM